MNIKIEKAKREDGFTLIELLVVVIIIGILAAIAIPVFLAQRERAWNSEAQSDLRNGAVAMETYYTDNGVYNADGLAVGFGFNESPNMTVTADIGGTNDQAYCLIGDHDNLAADATWFLGQGESGGELSQDRATACPDVGPAAGG